MHYFHALDGSDLPALREGLIDARVRIDRLVASSDSRAARVKLRLIDLAGPAGT